MRRLFVTTAAAVGLLALACTDERQESPTEPPSTATTAKTCPSSDPIQSQICALFPANDLRQSATDFYNNIKTKWPKDRVFAQARAIDLVNFTLKNLAAGKLLDPPSGTAFLPDFTNPTTQEAVGVLTCNVLKYVELSCGGLTSGALGTNGAAQVVGPNGGLVLTPDKHAGVSIPQGAMPSPGLITITPIDAHAFPARRGPLPTPFDQYLLFRDYSLSASFTQFSKPVIVGICHLSVGDGDFAPPTQAVDDRLQLAHPDPVNPTTIELLPRVAAPFLNCSDFNSTSDEVPPSIVIDLKLLSPSGLASVGRTLIRKMAPAFETLLPEPAEAAVLGSCCLGGATTKFSPWAAVDPGEISFFSSPDFGTQPFDPGGQSFFTDLPLSWTYSKDQSSSFAFAYPAVQVLDGNGTPLSGVDVTVSLVRVVGTGTLSGTLTQSTSGGNSAAGPNTAVFNDLLISQPGTYKLRFTAGGVTVDSGEFTVTVFTGPS
jgi:hypothetical protein